MMRNGCLLLPGWFGRADIHPPDHLHGVAVDDLSPQGAGEAKSQAALAGGGRSRNGNQQRITRDSIHDSTGVSLTGGLQRAAHLAEQSKRHLQNRPALGSAAGSGPCFFRMAPDTV